MTHSSDWFVCLLVVCRCMYWWILAIDTIIFWLFDVNMTLELCFIEYLWRDNKLRIESNALIDWPTCQMQRWCRYDNLIIHTVRFMQIIRDVRITFDHFIASIILIFVLIGVSSSLKNDHFKWLATACIMCFHMKKAHHMTNPFPFSPFQVENINIIITV